MSQQSRFINSRNISIQENNTISIPNLSWYTTTNTTTTSHNATTHTNRNRNRNLNFYQNDISQIQKHFKFTKQIAMKSLNLSSKDMKTIYSTHNIKRWPYRRLNSILIRKEYIHKLLSELQSTSTSSSNTTNSLKDHLLHINSIESTITNNPSYISNENFKTLLRSIPIPSRYTLK